MVSARCRAEWLRFLVIRYGMRKRIWRVFQMDTTAAKNVSRILKDAGAAGGRKLNGALCRQQSDLGGRRNSSVYLEMFGVQFSSHSYNCGCLVDVFSCIAPKNDSWPWKIAFREIISWGQPKVWKRGEIEFLQIGPTVQIFRSRDVRLMKFVRFSGEEKFQILLGFSRNERNQIK